MRWPIFQEREFAPGLSSDGSRKPAATDLAKRIYWLRRALDEMFGSELLADPVSEMLFDLLANAMDGRPTSVTSLGSASGVPVRTALRSMGLMEQANLIVRRTDPKDKRRTLISLTDSAMDRLSDLLATL